MRIQLRSLGPVATILLITLLSSQSAQAQGHPAMHWGAMELKTSVNNCLGRAKKAFSDANLQDTQHTGWQSYGVKGNANVLVSCSIGSNNGSYLVVVAASPDSKAAELLRNDIRSRIAAMREFD
jgi:hypothetical protein